MFTSSGFPSLKVFSLKFSITLNICVYFWVMFLYHPVINSQASETSLSVFTSGSCFHMTRILLSILVNLPYCVYLWVMFSYDRNILINPYPPHYLFGSLIIVLPTALFPYFYFSPLFLFLLFLLSSCICIRLPQFDHFWQEHFPILTQLANKF